MTQVCQEGFFFGALAPLKVLLWSSESKALFGAQINMSVLVCSLASWQCKAALELILFVLEFVWFPVFLARITGVLSPFGTLFLAIMCSMKTFISMM